MKYAFQFGEDTFYGRNYPHTSQGIGVAYNTFFNQAEIGSPVAVYVFQNSRIASLTKYLSLDYEWNFGVSFGWKKYDSETNRFNEVVGSQVNAYINLGLMLNWQLAPEWNLTTGIGFTHFSNGNTSYPNAGVNSLGCRVGLIRTFGPTNEENPRFYTRTKFKPFISYDVVIYGAARKKGIVMPDPNDAFLVPGSFGILGLNFSPMYNFNKFLSAGISLDFQYDESANIKDYIASDYLSVDNIKFHKPPFEEQFATGISLRGEVTMPIFSINVGLGRIIICKGKDTDDYYQLFVLKGHVTSSLFLQVGYQLYRFKDPNNLMLGMGYRFNNRKQK